MMRLWIMGWLFIDGLHHMGVSINGGITIAGWFRRENPWKSNEHGWWLGVPYPPPILGNLDINPLLFFGARCDRNWGVESVEYRLNIAWIPMIHHVMLNGSPMVDQQSMITTSRGFKPRFPSAKWVMSDHIQSRVAPSWLISACRLQLHPSHTHPC